MTDTERASLLAGLRARDPAVAGPLWRHFAPTIFRLLRRVMGTRTALDTAVQLVLLRVFHGGRRLGPNADLARFVVRTTVRIAQAQLRRRTLDRFRALWREGAARRLNARDRSEPDAVQRFYRIVDRLSAGDRIAFVLHQIEGLDVREVAAATGSSAKRTERRLRRSIRKIAAATDRDPGLRGLGAR